MEIIKDFKLTINQRKILDTLHCDSNSEFYDEVIDTYNELSKLIMENVEPKAFVKIKPKDNDLKFKETAHCSNIVYCLITLGNKIGDFSNDFFNEGDYLKGMLFDTMTDQLLFNLSYELYLKVVKLTKNLNLGLTSRLSPGECYEDIPLEFNKVIYDEFSINEVALTEGFMYNPVKTLGFFYGADKSLKSSRVDHNCNRCNTINCIYKDQVSKVKVIRKDYTKEITCKKDSNVLDELNRNNIFIPSHCNGLGKCGKCKIKIKEGFLIQEDSNGLNSVDNTSEKSILSCASYIIDDCTLELVNSEEGNFNILTSFVNNGICKNSLENSSFKIHNLNLTKKNFKNGESITEAIEGLMGNKLEFSLKALRNIGTLINTTEKIEYLLVENSYVIDALSCNSKAYGICVDIGTTTIVMNLIDLIDGKILNTYSLLNKQRQYGADVISRILFSMEGGKETLNTCILETLIDGIKILCCIENNYVYESVKQITISGNTTMIHLLLGIPCDLLGTAPFNSVTNNFMTFSFYEVFNSDILQCSVKILPGISTFVGGDIVSDMLYSKFAESEEINLLLDIGTNGEIVIGNKDKILCTATAAGPAFEGANIYCGTGSINGAIYKVDITEDIIHYDTILNKDPIGICGSGLISIISESLKNNIVDETGLIINEYYKEKGIVIAYNNLGEAIFINQKDIRELQLAKSAIKSGIEILLTNYDCTYKDIKNLYIAGGFGNNMDIASAINIGLIDNALKDKVKLIGNGSIGGAMEVLCDNLATDKIAKIKSISHSINIAETKEFNDLFIENLSF